MKTTITNSEKLQLLGLLTLGIRHRQVVDQVEKAMAEITETEVGGHLGDALYESDTDIDEILKRMGIAIVADADAERGTK